MTQLKGIQGKTFDNIRSLVEHIPAGRVATYGQIAALTAAGLPARIVGFALHGLPEKTEVPWHRVVNSKGYISFSPGRNEHEALQRILLIKEGISFSKDGKINLQKYLWHPEILNKSSL
jgi:methylated-DNA-protein-cysteine methyltransferase-like protein